MLRAVFAKRCHMTDQNQKVSVLKEQGGRVNVSRQLQCQLEKMVVLPEHLSADTMAYLQNALSPYIQAPSAEGNEEHRDTTDSDGERETEEAEVEKNVMLQNSDVEEVQGEDEEEEVHLLARISGQKQIRKTRKRPLRKCRQPISRAMNTCQLD